MIAEIILIPDGMGLDAAKASAQYVARGLSSIGMKVREHISVCPDETQFRQAVSTALARSNILLTLGGLSSQSGFMAKTVLSRGLGLPLEENAEALDGIREYCRKTGEQFDVSDEALAMLPRGGTAFPGSCGKIPGCAISSAKQHIIMMPELQQEIAPMFNRYVSAYLGGASTTTVTHTIRAYGVREAEVNNALSDILNSANPAVTVQKEENEILVRVAAHAPILSQAAALCTPVLHNIADRLGDAAYGLDVDSMQAAVVDKLDRKNLDLAIVDGGAGGMLTRVISETPNGQDVLRYSVSVDTPAAKEQKLGIKQKLIKKAGNVSEYAAVATAHAAREKGGSALGVSVLANTDGEKGRACPKGCVFIAVCDDRNVLVKKLIVGDGDADEDVITDAALSRALNMIRLFADYLPDAYPAAIPVDEALDGKSVTGLDEYEEDVDVSGEEREPLLRRFFGNFIIRATDKRGVKVRKFIFMLSMVIFLASAGYIGRHYYNAWLAQKQAIELQNMFSFGEMGDVEVSPDYPKGYSLKFAGLWNVNQDVAAFISIPETGVQYPVVQAEDNDYYLRRNFYGKSSQYGIPFMDYRVDLKEPSDNTVVYGHNMKDGQIFGELISYKNLDYYQKHPVIDFATVRHENKYKIISVFITNAYENQGPVFAYHDFIDAANNAEFEEYITEVTRRSIINTPVDVEKGDKLLTLSTCTYEFKDARLVIVARALRKGESEEVDVEKAENNPSPLYPDVWYSVFGGTKPSFDYASTSVAEIEEVATESTESAESEVAASKAESEAAAKKAESEATAKKAESEAAASKAESEAAAKKAESEAAVSKAESEAAAKKAESEAAASKAAAEAASQFEAGNASAEEVEADDETEWQDEEDVADEEDNGQFDSDDLLDGPGTHAIVMLLSVSELDADTAEAATPATESKKTAATSKTKTTPTTQAKTKTTKKTTSKKTVKKTSGTVTVRANGGLFKDADVFDIIPRVVQNEIGSSFEYEAIKAQAVAAYTFIMEANARGAVPSVYLAKEADDIVMEAVSEVLGQAVYYNGDYAFTPYHATSSGKTAASGDVWGGQYPYLVSVDSSVDKKAPKYKVKVTMTRKKVASLLSQKLGIKASGDPASWFEVIEYADGGYNGAMSVCGETQSRISGSTITGRLLREGVFGLRSSKFDVTYNSSKDTFTFTTYGYGHGVGMSQNGANLYAKKGWDYIKILEHYYPGTEIW